MRAILGTKIGMTQVWDDRGRLVGATVLKAEPNAVLANDEHSTLLGTQTPGKTNKPQQKLAAKLGSKGGIWLKQFPVLDEAEKVVTVTVFRTGEKVAISGVTKGKGFAGVVKRHGFAGWPASHGHSHQRRPGSIGAQRPQRVLKGKRMPGQMGHQSLTVRGNTVLAVDEKENLLVVSGAVPGARRSRVVIRSLK